MSNIMKQVSRVSVQDSKDWERGLEYAKKLGIEGQKELLRLCADTREDVSRRRLACLALGFFKYKAAVSVLLKLVDDDDLGLVLDSTLALGMIGSPRLVRPMISLAKGPARLDVRNRAIDVLGMLGDVRAEETLVGILRNRDEEESTRWYAADAIACLRKHSERAITCLLDTLKDTSALLRWHCLQALGTMGDQNSIPAIQACLTDEEIVPHLPSKETVSDAAQAAIRNIRACNRTGRPVDRSSSKP